DTVRKALVDQGFKKSVVEHGERHGIDVEIVERNPADKGFVPQVKRSYLVGGLDGPVVRSRGPETPGMAFKRLPSMVHPTWPPGVSRRLGR
ncbi:hypothetical protein ACFP50_32075, partial [Streptomyces pratens]